MWASVVVKGHLRSVSMRLVDKSLVPTTLIACLLHSLNDCLGIFQIELQSLPARERCGPQCQKDAEPTEHLLLPDLGSHVSIVRVSLERSKECR
jgi:hypothetical protein